MLIYYRLLYISSRSSLSSKDQWFTSRPPTEILHGKFFSFFNSTLPSLKAWACTECGGGGGRRRWALSDWGKFLLFLYYTLCMYVFLYWCISVRIPTFNYEKKIQPPPPTRSKFFANVHDLRKKMDNVYYLFIDTDLI